MKKNKVKIIASSKSQSAQEIDNLFIKKTIEWFFSRYPEIESLCISVSITNNLKKSWGSVTQHDPRTYHIEVSSEIRTIKTLVETLLHECVHIYQWVTNEWEGDGEEEAIRESSTLVNLIWAEGII